MFKKLLKNRQAVDASDQYSTALLQDDFESVQSLEDGSDIAANLNHLHQIANHVYTRMTPVTPDEEFKDELKAKLAAIQSGQEERVELWTGRKQSIGKVSRILATVVSVIAVIAVIVRIVGSIFALYAYLAGRKQQKQTATI